MPEINVMLYLNEVSLKINFKMHIYLRKLKNQS